jgi:hypothetical protein
MFVFLKADKCCYVIVPKYYVVPGMAHYVGLVLAIILSSSEFSSTGFEHVSTCVTMSHVLQGWSSVDFIKQEYFVIWLL